jgi:hypothetical protein
MGSCGEVMVYRVTFYKILHDSSGHSHDCCQGAIEVLAASEKDAIEAASRRFAELHEIKDWRLRAERAQAEAIAGRKRISSAVWRNSISSFPGHGPSFPRAYRNVLRKVDKNCAW